PPSPPFLIPHGNDEDSVDVGIDAVSEGDWIYLEWRENPEEDLAGYIVYRDSLPNPGFTPISSLIQDTFYMDKNLTLGIRYYYTVTAVDTAGNESNRAVLKGGDTLNYQLASKPFLLSPLEGDSLPSSSIIFRWNLDSASDGFFIVKAFSSVDGQLLQMGDVEEFFTPQSEYADTLFLPQGSYRWRVDYGITGQNLGSESRLRDLTIK
ncbi:fibronectin type III domain-containing protein, partial [candidate division TA06 bacterium]|nr:fibronectin type III domain-containing protein [candidate division TA06 bacterium]